MLLTTLDELNINHGNWNIYRISQSGFCSVEIAWDSQRSHSSQYNTLHWGWNPDVCWMLEKVRFRLETRHRFLWWWSLSTETSCQRAGRVLQHQTTLNWDRMMGLTWRNSLLYLPAVQIITLPFLPWNLWCSLDLNPLVQTFLVLCYWLSTELLQLWEQQRSVSWTGTWLIKWISSGGSGLAPCPSPNPIQLVNTLSKS